jgi:CRISPR-associated protein Cmr5
MSRTLEQHRAKYALGRIQHVQGFTKSDDKARYATLVRKLPTMILNNGLGQALAFLLADDEGKDKPSGGLYKHIEKWLSGPIDPDHPARVYRGDTPSLIDQLINGDRAQYLRAQQEALALLVWMKKFADAYLPKGGE